MPKKHREAGQKRRVKLTKMAAMYIILAIIGIVFSVYSIKAGNYILLAAAGLFAIVSADNIFCNLK